MDGQATEQDQPDERPPLGQSGEGRNPVGGQGDDFVAAKPTYEELEGSPVKSQPNRAYLSSFHTGSVMEWTPW